MLSPHLGALFTNYAQFREILEDLQASFYDWERAAERAPPEDREALMGQFLRAAGDLHGHLPPRPDAEME